jgi:hypothetical protein
LSSIIRFLSSVLCLLLVTSFSNAQPYQPLLNIPVTQYGNTLSPAANAWTGGFNTPVFSPIDLNGDGIKDLFIFEKEGASQTYYRYTTYINHGTNNQVDYEYEPQYENCFPKFLHDWVLLVDYDCDGYEDIFTYSFSGGMTVYHNDFPIVGSLKFHESYTLVNSSYYGFTSNLFVSAVNLPALVDVDNDGDLDVLTFSLSSGTTVEFHRNYAMETQGRCDTLIYKMEKSCWGKFCLTGTSNVATLGCPISNCPDGPLLNEPDGGQVLRHLHELHDSLEKITADAGSCMIAPDLDGDGDKDIINGDIHSNFVLMLHNGGTSDSAYMTAQDTAFPVYDTTANFRIYPSPFYFDVDNDGNKDFIVTGCARSAARNFNNVLFYKNTTDNTTNVFHYIKNSLFVDQMIEVGSGANVTLVDVDGDGLKDMVISNYKYIDQLVINDGAGAAYFRNTGTAAAPAFNLVTTDFANLSSMGVFGLSLTFGDLDGDGDQDLIVGGSDGYLNYFENISGNYILTLPHMNSSTGNPIYCGSYATPQLVDLNIDGKLDLVIGEHYGNLNYFSNTGTVNSPVFTFVTDSLGFVNVTKKSQDIYGSSAPCFYSEAGSFKLVVGSLSGYVYKYDNISGNLNGHFTLVDSVFLYEPIQSTVAAADINGDGKTDFLVGNNSGGVKWYSNTITGVNEIQQDQNCFYMYPNPVKDIVHIKFVAGHKSLHHEIRITDVLGKTLYASQNNLFLETIDMKKWSNGMYLCKVMVDGIIANKKFIVQH